MDTREFTALFSHFQNLNLLFLIRDLERGLVARQAWVYKDKAVFSGQDQPTLCPIAHGCWENATEIAHLGIGTPGFLERMFGNPLVETAERFIVWWDNWKPYSAQDLLAALRAIYAERLADADAVQAVIFGPFSRKDDDHDEQATNAALLPVSEPQPSLSHS